MGTILTEQNGACTATERGACAPVPADASHVLLLGALLLLTGLTYSWTIGHVPLRGEESRWACGARWMLASGDWIVPRQQGTVFPERPPLNSWLMASVGAIRGEVDSVAIRLPSLLATLATMAVLYAFGRSVHSAATGLMAAAIFGSFGQVLQLGVFGESEAVFTFFVSTSLMAWYGLWRRSTAPWKCWATGFTLAALGALTKGLQAPIYFVVATTACLVCTRQWRAMFHWHYAAGATAGAAVVAAWLVPFYLATDAQTVADIWTGLARDRVQLQGLLKHLATYPLETFACLLPWSPLLFQYIYRDTRRSAGPYRRTITFLAVSLGATYPSVWWVAGARGRYYMPMYPLVAVLIAIAIAASVESNCGWSRRGWKLWQTVMAVLIPATGVGSASAAYLVPKIGRWLEGMQWLTWSFAAGSLVAGVALALVAARRSDTRSGGLALPSVLIVASWAILSFGCIFFPAYGRQLNDLTPTLATIKARYRVERLVSLGPIYHRFAYYYGDPIDELPWPGETDVDLNGVEYFCFDVLRGDTREHRAFGRGRSFRPVPAQLPFEWTEVARLACDPQRRRIANRTVVIGRINRDARGRIAWRADRVERRIR